MSSRKSGGNSGKGEQRSFVAMLSMTRAAQVFATDDPPGTPPGGATGAVGAAAGRRTNRASGVAVQRGTHLQVRFPSAAQSSKEI